MEGFSFHFSILSWGAVVGMGCCQVLVKLDFGEFSQAICWYFIFYGLVHVRTCLGFGTQREVDLSLLDSTTLSSETSKQGWMQDFKSVGSKLSKGFFTSLCKSYNQIS